MSIPAVIHFVRSGQFTLSIGYIRNAGSSGYGWSSRASDKDINGTDILSGYNLDLNVTSVNPITGPYGRRGGFPLRCLSTV